MKCEFKVVVLIVRWSYYWV